MKQNLYILRHAQTYFSKNDIAYGRDILTANILPEGIPPIKKAAEFLKNKNTDYNVCSEYLRCKETARIVTEITKKKFTYDKNLNEFNNESIQELKKRVEIFLESIKQYENVLICTHGGVIAAIKHLVLYNEFEEENLPDYPITGTILVINSKKIELIDFNDN